LMAMWNAPLDQPEHAVLACRAALAILAELPRMSEDWRAVVGGPLSIGLGLNTGLAMVGNTGSKHKFKYGPLGHAVNLASRVEGATKHLGTPALVTGSTRQLLGDKFAVRRLCRLRVLGVQDAVDLYELHAESADPEWLELRNSYEKALALFETGQWTATCREIYPILAAGPEEKQDGPSLDLLARAIECIKSPPESFDPTLELSTK